MSAHTMPLVVSATSADVPQVARLVATAFSVLDATAWLIADPQMRIATVTGQFEIIVEHALSYGTVEMLADGSAAAVWLDREGSAPPPEDYDRRLAEVCGPYTERFQILDKLFETNHPEQPHHHLAFLGVAEGYQCTGRGTQLMRHYHAKLDKEGIPSYLEAASSRSRGLYAREGYEPWEPFALPDGPYFYPMWREPAPKHTH